MTERLHPKKVGAAQARGGGPGKMLKPAAGDWEAG